MLCYSLQARVEGGMRGLNRGNPALGEQAPPEQRDASRDAVPSVPTGPRHRAGSGSHRWHDRRGWHSGSEADART